MPMNGNTLGSKWWTDFQTLTGMNPSGLTTTQSAAGLAYFQMLANDLVAHVIANAVVTVTTSTPGVQAGSSTAPGTGTGSITA
jgi:hypothetical protein